MCTNCVTQDQIDASRNFQASVGQVTLTGHAELEQHVGQLSASGFSQDVRDYVLAKLPKVHTSFTPVVCAYCGKPKDFRSMELDHIIPVRAYVRYQLVQTYRNGPSPKLDEVARSAKEAYAHSQNLAFACTKCNKAKSDAFPDSHTVRITNLTALAALAHNLPNRSTDFTALGLIQTQLSLTTNLSRYYRGEFYYMRRSERMVRRSNLAKTYRYHPYASANTPQPDPEPAYRIVVKDSQTGQELTDNPLSSERLRSETLAVIELAIGNLFRLSRPSMHSWLGEDGFAALLKDQTQAKAEKDLRVCLYCNGLFHKQAFEIEHCNPVNRNPLGQSNATVRSYNSDLIGICGSCNGARGKATLTVGLLDSLRQKRMDQALPGLEMICTDMADAARVRLRALLAL